MDQPCCNGPRLGGSGGFLVVRARAWSRSQQYGVFFRETRSVHCLVDPLADLVTQIPGYRRSALFPDGTGRGSKRTRSSFGCSLGFYLAPRVPQGYDAVKHQPVRARILGVLPKISEARELESRIWPVAFDAWLNAGVLQDFQCLRIKILLEVAISITWYRSTKESVVEVDFHGQATLGVNPMNGALNLRTLCIASLIRVVGAQEFGDRAVCVPDYLVALDDVGIAQPDGAARRKPPIALRRFQPKVLAFDQKRA